MMQWSTPKTFRISRLEGPPKNRELVGAEGCGGLKARTGMRALSSCPLGPGQVQAQLAAHSAGVVQVAEHRI